MNLVDILCRASGSEGMLKEKYGTPYVIGTPYKEYAERISEALEKRIQIPAIEDRRRENLQGTGNSEKIITLIGEPVTIGSLAAINRKKNTIIKQGYSVP